MPDKSVSIRIDPSLLRLGKGLERAEEAFLIDSGDRVQAEAKKLKPPKSFKDRSGRLRTSILRDKVNMKEKSVLVIATVGTPGNSKDPAYGIFVNDGTRHMKGFFFMEGGLSKVTPIMERLMVSKLNKYM